MSPTEQATKKYCCFRRSALPSSVWSFGYRTFEMFSESIFSSTARRKSPSLKYLRSKSRVARAAHNLRVFTVLVLCPTMNES
jgi:hypothetical protein